MLTCASLCQHAAKQAAASATQTIAAAQHASSSNKNPAAQQQLVQSCKVRAWAWSWHFQCSLSLSHLPSAMLVLPAQPQWSDWILGSSLRSLRS